MAAAQGSAYRCSAVVLLSSLLQKKQSTVLGAATEHSITDDSLADFSCLVSGLQEHHAHDQANTPAVDALCLPGNVQATDDNAVMAMLSSKPKR